jgi:hypothetical protein
VTGAAAVGADAGALFVGVMRVRGSVGAVPETPPEILESLEEATGDKVALD